MENDFDDDRPLNPSPVIITDSITPSAARRAERERAYEEQRRKDSAEFFAEIRARMERGDPIIRGATVSHSREERGGRGGPRRSSVHVADWRPIPKPLWGRLMSLVEEFERLTRTKGQQGALKQSGVTLFRAMLFGFLNPRTGQCDPCYETLAARAGLSRATVHEALGRLERFGLLERTRRVVKRPIIVGGRAVGATWEQTSNAYKLGPPRRVDLLHDVSDKAAELWDAWVLSWERMLKDAASFFRSTSESSFPSETTPAFYRRCGEAINSPLTAALDRLGEAIGVKVLCPP